MTTDSELLSTFSLLQALGWLMMWDGRLKPVFHQADYSARKEKPIVIIEFRQKRTLKSRIKFNFSAAENFANQSYCSLCVPRDQNNSRSVHDSV